MLFVGRLGILWLLRWVYCDSSVRYIVIPSLRISSSEELNDGAQEEEKEKPTLDIRLAEDEAKLLDAGRWMGERG